MSFLAMDIGGANLKVADGEGYAAHRKLPLWRRSQELASQLRQMIAEAPPQPRLAVTMTAELADCFPSKSAGVLAVLDAVEEAAGGRPVRVYRNDGRLVAPAVIRTEPLRAAATNWHALARFAAAWAESAARPALLVDVGSSTCDVIPLGDPAQFPPAASDTQRLLNGQLLYLGVERTPICSLLAELPYRGQMCGVARELFATTLDSALLLGRAAEDTAMFETADGRAATKAFARQRLSRMLCAADDEFNHRDAVSIATAVEQRQADWLAETIRRVATGLESPPAQLVLSGQGEWLARLAVDSLGWRIERRSLTAELGSFVSRSAPAHALAVLARESL